MLSNAEASARRAKVDEPNDALADPTLNEQLRRSPREVIQLRSLDVKLRGAAETSFLAGGREVTAP